MYPVALLLVLDGRPQQAVARGSFSLVKEKRKGKQIDRMAIIL